MDDWNVQSDEKNFVALQAIANDADFEDIGAFTEDRIQYGFFAQQHCCDLEHRQKWVYFYSAYILIEELDSLRVGIDDYDHHHVDVDHVSIRFLD